LGGGFGLTRRDAINYVQFLSTTAAKYGLAVGLKNGLEILTDVKNQVQFAVNEECVKANECDKYRDFLVKDHKAVFHIEYPTRDRPKTLGEGERKRACGDRSKAEVKSSPYFQTVIKIMKLDGWVTYCNGTVATTPTRETSSRYNTKL
jgi:hypothetical protein